MARMVRGSGTLNSRLSILVMLLTRLVPTRLARKAARKTVMRAGSVTESPRSRSTLCLS